MLPIRSIARYADHFKNAKGRYRIHSPFVYELLSQNIRDEEDKRAYAPIEKVLHELRKDPSRIEVTDLGAGSRWTGKKLRRVDRMAKKTGCSKRTGRLLYRLADRFAQNDALELGTSLGIGTMYLASGTKGTLHSIEACPASLGVAERNLKKAGVTNVALHEGDFRHVLKELLPTLPKLDLIRIDGDHREDPTLEYFEYGMEKAHNDTLFIIDDIHWSDGMERAWETLKGDPRISLSLDLFHLGLLFIRSEQREALHLRIRF